MNLKQLEVFLAVAETGSFSQGAENTFLTQSTVSQHIAALEKEFGVKLLDRTGRGALLTEGGKLLREHALRLFADAEKTKHALQKFKGVEDTLLMVGGSNIPGDYLIPAALPFLFQRSPGLSISMAQGDSQAIIEKLAREEVEIAVVGTAFQLENIDFEPLTTENIHLVAKGKHPFAKRGGMELKELMLQPVILREEGSGTARAVEDSLRLSGIDPGKLSVKARLGSNESVKNAVAAGVGMAFLPELSIGKELERGELSVMHVKGVKVMRSFHIATRASRELSPAARVFREVMKEVYS